MIYKSGIKGKRPNKTHFMLTRLNLRDVITGDNRQASEEIGGSDRPEAVLAVDRILAIERGITRGGIFQTEAI